MDALLSASRPLAAEPAPIASSSLYKIAHSEAANGGSLTPTEIVRRGLANE